MAEEPLVSISEASHILGVSEAALRLWTSEGKVKAFITPGGHRRYSRAELKKFSSSHSRMLGIKDLVYELKDTVPTHRELARRLLSNTSWYGHLNEEAQESLAHQGRIILNLIIKYVTEPAKREETIQQARDTGRQMGKLLALLGLPLTDSVEAFIMHRDPVLNAATHLMRKKEAFTGRVVEAIPLVAKVLDEALVSLVAAHQLFRSGVPAKPGGNTE